MLLADGDQATILARHRVHELFIHSRIDNPERRRHFGSREESGVPEGRLSS
jgi:hypothetical protein